MRRLSSWKTAGAVGVLCVATAVALPAQTFTTLFSFDGTDGNNPYAGLVQATNGNLYGTTQYGGARGAGTAFAITPSGGVNGLLSFCPRPTFGCGSDPVGGLIQALNGNFYGTTYRGGSKLHGTVFEINQSGKLTTLHTFEGLDGIAPKAAPVQGTDMNFYGTTYGGGKYGCGGCGTVFKITSSGTLTTLYEFCSLTNCVDGAYPWAGLTEATDGNFYGTTEFGGASQACTSDGGCGTVFKISSSGTLTTLYSFCSQPNCTDGADPVAGLVQAADGNFYGTTSTGGTNNNCEPFSGCGTVFKITPSGTLTTLYSFCSQSGCPDGEYPYGGLIQATDGNLYGTTSQGGAYYISGVNLGGTVFQITTSGTLTTLHSFCSQSNCADGQEPYAGLLQDTNGNLYGTTGFGGASGEYGPGTVFSLSIGLDPFVETQPTSAKVGTPINILGSTLTGATSVTFNGTAASFSVVSESLIKAYVPSGATSGTVQVVTPGGTLSSNVPFRVVP